MLTPTEILIACLIGYLCLAVFAALRCVVTRSRLRGWELALILLVSVALGSVIFIG